MSKIGKNPIIIPDKTDVSVVGGTVTVKGPLGQVSRSYAPEVTVAVEGGSVTVTPKGNSKFARSLWGTTASHIKNMIKGVHTKYEKKLELQGVGYKVELQGGKALKFSVGFSHPVVLPVPEGVTVAVEKTLMTVTGIDKDAVGQFAAVIREVKKPEPYKGKGIRYVGEYVREKQGKKAVG
jgi:large subunit ribosomal protein L6